MKEKSITVTESIKELFDIIKQRHPIREFEANNLKDIIPKYGQAWQYITRSGALKRVRHGVYMINKERAYTPQQIHQLACKWGSDRRKLNKEINMPAIEVKDDKSFELECIAYLKDKGYKISKPVIVTTYEDI